MRDVPRQVERAVRQALARAPADRFADAPAFARALEAAAGDTRTSTRPFVRRVLLAALGGLLIAAALVGLYSGLRPEPERARDPNLLAVAPFDVLDPSLQLWREGLGDILSRTLDGAGPIRTVSPTVVLRRWSGRADRGLRRRAEPPDRRGTGRLRSGGAAGPGLGDAPRRPPRSRWQDGQERCGGGGRGRSDRRACRLPRNQGPAGALAEPADRVCPLHIDRREVASGTQGIPAG